MWLLYSTIPASPFLICSISLLGIDIFCAIKFLAVSTKSLAILLIDNIGSEQFSQYYHVQYLIPILEYRYKNNLTTYFISQYDIEELKKYYLNNIINNGRNDAFKKDIFKLIDLIKSLYKLKFELKGNSQR